MFLGAINRSPDVQIGSYIRAIMVTRSRSIIAHPSYDASNIINDVGLVELPEEAPIENSYIGIVSLPKGSQITQRLVGLPGTVAGYGKTQLF